MSIKKFTYHLFLDFKRILKKTITISAYFHFFKAKERKRLIIEIEHGGLGDNLFFSHIPRIAKIFGGYDEVLYSTFSKMRNKEHLIYCWLSNPYLDGFTDAPGQLVRKNIEDYSTGNILDKIMYAFKLNDGLTNHKPEIYFKIKKNRDLKNSIIFDPNWITDLYDIHIIENKVKEYFDVNNIKVDYILPPKNVSFKSLNFSAIYLDRNFSEYCRAIKSCKEFYCFASGSAVLAEALGKKATVFYSDKVNNVFLFSKSHNYVKI